MKFTFGGHSCFSGSTTGKSRFYPFITPIEKGRAIGLDRFQTGGFGLSNSLASRALVLGALHVGLLLTISGCAHTPLRKSTAQTTSTLADLHFQLILDNVARFQENPDTLPSFAVATAGTVSISDQAGVGISPTYSPTLGPNQQGGGALPIVSLLFPASAQRSLTENWSLTPITDSDNLRRLRCAYRLLVLGKELANYEFCEKQMREFFVGEEVNWAETFPPRGWYSTGRKAAIPKNACYIGRHGATYVWVTPGGMNALAVFAMGALDLATGKLHNPQRTTVRRYKGPATPENLVEVQMTVVEDDPDAMEAIRKARTHPPLRQRGLEPTPLNPGLLLLPRP